MTHEASFRTVFPAKKDTKRHTKHLVSGSMCYPRHLDGIPKKWPFSCHPLMICFWKVIDLTEGESINLILRQTVWTRFLTWWILQNSSLMYHIQHSFSVKLFWQFLDPHDINLPGSRPLCDSVTKFHPEIQRPLWSGSGLNQDFSF